MFAMSHLPWSLLLTIKGGASKERKRDREAENASCLSLLCAVCNYRCFVLYVIIVHACGSSTRCRMLAKKNLIPFCRLSDRPGGGHMKDDTTIRFELSTGIGVPPWGVHAIGVPPQGVIPSVYRHGVPHHRYTVTGCRRPLPRNGRGWRSVLGVKLFNS
ncbi:hypothetical protein ElyMa_002968100 [Elysia marginata]|uniref:Secreted protein n=1 Tax=Elysia marginata TaxID=1093978 RepID=A0AAV4I823_9GAST|nr:hypothetical protein ElyMa_002968100 [Elysia marginata]